MCYSQDEIDGAVASATAAKAIADENLACALRWQELGLQVFWCRVEKTNAGWLKTPLHRWRTEPAPNDPHWLRERHDWAESWIARQPGMLASALPAIVVTDRIIIDLDRHEGGSNGVAGFLDLTANETIRESWVVSRTAGSGLHIHFAPHPEMIGNSAAGLPAGIDVRAGGRGYVIACGAVRADGLRYEPLAGNPFVPGGILPELPESLLAAVRKAREDAGASGGGFAAHAADQLAGPDERAYHKKALDNACLAFRHDRASWSNNVLNAKAFSIFRQCAGGYGDPSAAANALLNAASDGWNPTHEQFEALRRTIESAWFAAQRSPLGLLPVPPRDGQGNAIPPHLR